MGGGGGGRGQADRQADRQAERQENGNTGREQKKTKQKSTEQIERDSQTETQTEKCLDFNSLTKAQPHLEKDAYRRIYTQANRHTAVTTATISRHIQVKMYSYESTLKNWHCRHLFVCSGLSPAGWEWTTGGVVDPDTLAPDGSLSSLFQVQNGSSLVIAKDTNTVTKLKTANDTFLNYFVCEGSPGKDIVWMIGCRPVSLSVTVR